MSIQAQDLIGRVYGSLTVLRRAPKRPGPVRWVIQCVCGDISEVQGGALKYGNKRTCSTLGCAARREFHTLARGRRPARLGERFGSLDVIAIVGVNEAGGVVVRCRCACGAEKDIRLRSLRSGQTKTCGCGNGVRQLVEYMGGETTIRQIALREGVGVNTLRDLLRAGIPIDEAVRQSKEARANFDRRRAPVVHGVGLSIDQVALLSGLSRKRVISQLSRGLNADDIVSGKSLPIASALQLKGQRFGRMVVLEFAGTHPKRKMTMWTCRCDCGRIHTAAGAELKSGHTTSCGCSRWDPIAGTDGTEHAPLRTST